MHNIGFTRGIRRLLRASALSLLVIGGATACDNLLEVENPAAIDDADLNDFSLATTLANSALGRAQRNFDDLAWFSAVFTDEAVNGHNFIQWKEIDLRQMRDDNDLGHWSSIHDWRYLADTVATRLESILSDPDNRTAQSYAFAGYAYVFAGEFMCESPINVSAEVFTSDELTAMAIPRFQRAIQLATAARAAGGAAQTTADNIINLARVGLGRAHLQLGQDAEAIAAVTPVPANFVWMMRYSGNTGGENNLMRGATTGANRYFGVDSTYRFLNDVRIRHAATPVFGHNTITPLYTPFQVSSYSGWLPTGAGVAYALDTGIRFASGLEARYIRAEAEGANATTLALVNERRAVGGQGITAAVGAALMAELREQRRRDFYADGHRLGDLRRYKKEGIGDFFPRGAHPVALWGNYGDSECLPIPRAEKTGNPNLGT
ncbi:MAG TPA: hypothetical protein VGD49_08860 [Longimicrobiales bacterium]